MAVISTKKMRHQINKKENKTLKEDGKKWKRKIKEKRQKNELSNLVALVFDTEKQY